MPSRISSGSPRSARKATATSPCPAGKVFIGTNNEPPRDPKHQGDRSILLCFDEKTGAFLWQLVVPKLASGKVNDWESLGLLASPTVEGDRVYLVTSRCEVICLDVNGMANGNDGPFKDEAKYVVKDVLLDRGKPTERKAPPIEPGPQDADIIWVYDMMDELGVFPHNASNCSVLIVDDIIYTCTSNGQDWTHSNIPSPNAPSFIALDKKTGKFLGEDDAKIGPHILHGQWGSPTLAEVNGKKQIVFGGGDGWCYSFDAKPVETPDGPFLKTVWKYDANPPEYKKDKDGKPIKYPAAEGVSEINATPVFWKNRIYVATGQDPEHGEGVGILTCIDATKTGDVTTTAKIWEYRGIHRSISTVSHRPGNRPALRGRFLRLRALPRRRNRQALLDARHEGAHVGLDLRGRRQSLCWRRRRRLRRAGGDEGKESHQRNQSRRRGVWHAHRGQRRGLSPIQHAPVRLRRSDQNRRHEGRAAED